MTITLIFSSQSYVWRMALSAIEFALPVRITNRFISQKLSPRQCSKGDFKMRLKPMSIGAMAVIALFGVPSAFAFAMPKIHPKTPEQHRAEYMARLQQQYIPTSDERT